MHETFLTDKQEVADYYKTHRRDTSNLEACLTQLLTQAGSCDVRVLVLGCGGGFHDVFPLIRCVKRSATYHGKIAIDAVDRSNEMIKLLQRSIPRRITGNLRQKVLINAWTADIERDLSLAEKYDLVLAISVLQHTINWRDVLNKLIPALRKGGHVVIDEWLNDSPLAPLDCPTAKEEFRLFSVLREMHTGILWDPEVRAHDMLAVRNYFKASGFAERVWEQRPKLTRKPSAENLDLKQYLIEAQGFGPLAWGRGQAYDTFVRERKSTFPVLSLAMSGIGFRVFCFARTRVQDPVHEISTPVFEGRIANRFCLKLPKTPASGMDAEMLRHVQALQAGLHYSCFNSRTRFAFSIVAKHDSKTGELDLAGTRPTRAVLVAGPEENNAAVDTLMRLLTNILVLPRLTTYGSVTADLLKIFEDSPDLSQFSFRLTLGGSKPLACRKVIDGLDLLDCTLPHRESPAVYAQLRQRVHQELLNGLLDKNSLYTFGKFRIVDLEAIRQTLINEGEIQQLAADSADALKPVAIKPWPANRQQNSIEKVLQTFARLIPMMKRDEELLLAFSPVQYRLDEEHDDKTVRAVSLGALAVLEERGSEPDSMLAFRIARMEFLDLAFQWRLFSELYDAVSPLASDFAMVRKRREALLNRLIELDSENFHSEKPWADIVKWCNDNDWSFHFPPKAQPTDPLSGTDTLSHLLFLGPKNDWARQARGLCSRLCGKICEAIKVVLPTKEDAGHVAALKEILRPQVFDSFLWWPLLGRSESPVDDFWPKYFAWVLKMPRSVTVRFPQDIGPFFIPFLAFPLGAFNFDDVRRPTPQDADIYVTHTQSGCEILLRWTSSSTCESCSIQEILLDKPGETAAHVAGRLKFLKRLFAEVDGKGFYYKGDSNFFSYRIGYGNG
jgi:SAM-dependent methyltransferase